MSVQNSHQKPPVVRTCQKCGAVGITEWQYGEGYNSKGGEMVPQWCPSCGQWLGQSHWGRVEDITTKGNKTTICTQCMWEARQRA